MASTHYDVAVIGAGPGGYVAAIRAAQLGAKVAIVEKQYLGGTCLNVGCIPSKAMLHIAEVMHSVASMGELGIELPQLPTLDMRKVVSFTDRVVKCMTGGIGVLMKGNRIDVFDDEVRAFLVRSLSKRGITIITNAKVESITDEGNSKKVTASTPQGEQSYSGEYVLMAVSRRANMSGLERLMEQGLDNDRGRVRVNEKMETNLPGIYAIGDLVHGAGLAHVASAEGEVAADNAMGHDAEMDYNVVPNPIYTFPEIAFVGLTEAQAKESSPDVRVERFPWAANGKAVGSANSEGFTKVILGKYNEILGAHIIGPDATNLITEYSVAMRGELTAEEIIETIHPHPTLSEGLREAVLAAEGRPIHIPPKQAARVR